MPIQQLAILNTTLLLIISIIVLLFQQFTIFKNRINLGYTLSQKAMIDTPVLYFQEKIKRSFEWFSPFSNLFLSHKTSL